MVDLHKYSPRLSRRAQLGLGGAVLFALGAAGGAGAVAATRPSVEMAPIVRTAIAQVPQRTGVLTIKGRIAEVYGDRFVLDDGSGRMLVDAGRHSALTLGRGEALTVQGRYDDGQVRASYLVDPQGQVEAVGAPPRPPHGPRGPHGPHGADGPDRADAPPPPPPGVAPPPPPPLTGAVPAANSAVSSPLANGVPPAPTGSAAAPR